MRIKVLLAALAALVLATNVAGSAHAGTQDASPTVASAASDPYRGVVIASGLTPAGRAGVRATEPPSCYTHFAPPYPNGVTSLAHYYRNCNGFCALRVRWLPTHLGDDRLADPVSLLPRRLLEDLALSGVDRGRHLRHVRLLRPPGSAIPIRGRRAGHAGPDLVAGWRTPSGIELAPCPARSIGLKVQKLRFGT